MIAMHVLGLRHGAVGSGVNCTLGPLSGYFEFLRDVVTAFNHWVFHYLVAGFGCSFSGFSLQLGVNPLPGCLQTTLRLSIGRWSITYRH